MAGEAEKDIPLYIKKLGAAAHERQVTQEELESTKDLGGSERMRAEARVRRFNLDIATYAGKINKALKSLSKSQTRIDPIRVPAGITDPKLEQYLRSVQNTVESLSDARCKDLQRRGQDERELDSRRGEARRMVQQAERSITKLKREREKVQRELKKIERLQTERARQVAPVKSRLEKAEKDLARTEEEVRKLERSKAECRREREALTLKKQGLVRRRGSEKRTEERQRLRQQETDLDARIEQLQRRETEHVDFRLTELKKIEAQLRDEQRKLREAIESTDREKKDLGKEIERLKGYDQDAKTQLDQETERLEKIREVESELKAVAAEPA